MVVSNVNLSDVLGSASIVSTVDCVADGGGMRNEFRVSEHKVVIFFGGVVLLCFVPSFGF